MKRGRRWKASLPVMMISLAVAGLMIITLIGWRASKEAVVLDVLSKDYPNPEFIKEVRNILESRGFKVHFYDHGNVSLEIFRTLPSRGYELVIIRTHGGRIRQPAGLMSVGGVFVERCGPGDYPEYTRAGYLLRGRPFLSNETYCVAPPHFISDRMLGRFPSSLIIVMACYTGDNEALATSFLHKGAEAYVGFRGEVSPQYADAFTIQLLRNLYQGNMTLEDAFNQALDLLGEDALFGGRAAIYS